MKNIQTNEVERKIYEPQNAIACLVLAHGAGAGNQHEFMEMLSTSLCQLNIRVVSFNFPYMQTMYLENKRKPPNRLPILLEHFEKEVMLAKETKLPLFIGGKSMGGRIASILNTQSNSLYGALVYGYPFIPPGKPEKLAERTSHLPSQKSPLFIFQGERDTFGNKALLNSLSLPKEVSIEWVTDGDHSFKPRKASGKTIEQNVELAAKQSASFIVKQLSS